MSIIASLTSLALYLENKHWEQFEKMTKSVVVLELKKKKVMY